MSTQINWFGVRVCIFMSLLSFEALSYTNDLEVQTLREMYMAMGSPPQLDNWNLNDGHSDPCKEAWRGVGCSGPVVTQINLKGLNLTGVVAYHIFNLQSLTHFFR
ncbi:unnamed protein product [Cuscuta epithymum]|uniref:Leucine-rich repeat-containing N-terminal plant-type domain-containing protein n=1 Tax=Cuscuta epithymum TaxID=186058 RepID=A0AAV0CP65_9ASTE|nr:unnamed protein product [Cuscuta epithymum]